MVQASPDPKPDIIASATCQMPILTRTFRVFVSSTFEDLKEERNALQRKAEPGAPHHEVFPSLRKLCEEHGARFQAIDLRWGVRDEAALDQKTMEICLREIERCQRTGIKPNFIVLLGQRYGWRPLPARIEVSEFEDVRDRIADPEDHGLVESWYRRDDNAVPPEYLLKPRTGEWVDRTRWEEIEARLHRILLDGARAACLSDQALVKYSASATHQEILKGLSATPEDRRHVFAFCRDVPGNECDPALVRLKEFLRAQLPAGNLRSYAPDDLEGLCQDVEQTLRAVIESEASGFESRPAQALEIKAHDDFARERALVFGRKEVLKEITEYVCAGGERPLVLYGVSGSGKSAVMAQASERAEATLPSAVVIRRFIGASPDSSSGLTLLPSLSEQIGEAYGASGEMPTDFIGVARVFRERLRLATSDRPLVVFVDAPDQLGKDDPMRSLTWLGGALPPHCRVVVSTTDVVPALNECKPLKLEVLPQAEAATALDHWFAAARRQLQPAQRQWLLEAFSRCGLPLYLRLAFEEARGWASYLQQQECPLGEGVEGAIDTLLNRLSLEANHGPLLVGRGLGYLAAARYGLTEEEMLDVLSADEEIWQDFERRAHHTPPERRLPVIVWSRLFLDLEPYLAERSVPGGTVTCFYHPQLVRQVAAKFVVGEGGRLRHASLARYFRRKADPAEDGMWQGCDPRGFAELPHHQIHAQLLNDVFSTLTDFLFMRGKCDAAVNGVHGLQQDLREAIEQWPAMQREQSDERRTLIESTACLVRLHHNEWADDSKRILQQMYPWLRWWSCSGVHQPPQQSGSAEWLERARTKWGRTTWPWLRQLTCPPMVLKISQVSHEEVSRGFFAAEGRQIVTVGRETLVWDFTTLLPLPSPVREWGSRRVHVISYVGAAGTFDTPAAMSRQGFLALATGLKTTNLMKDGIGCDVSVLHVESGELAAKWTADSSPLRGIEWSPDGTLLAVVSADGRASLWRFPSGHLERCLLEAYPHGGLWRDAEYPSPGDDWPTRPAFSADGEYLAIGRKTSCYLWRIGSKDYFACLEDSEPESISCDSFSADGSLLAVGRWNGTIRIWRLDTLDPGVLLKGPSRMVTDLAWAPKRPQLVATYAFGDVLLWTNESPPSSRRVVQCGSTATSVVFAPDSHTVLVTEENGICHVCDADAYPRSYWSDNPPTVEMDKVLFHPIVWDEDGNLVVASVERGLCLIDGHDGHGIAETRLGDEAVTAMVCQPDTGALYAGTATGKLLVLDDQLRPRRTREIPELGPVHSLACLRDGSLVANNIQTGAVCVWDPLSDAVWAPLQPEQGGALAVVSPDGVQLACIRQLQSYLEPSPLNVRIWDLRDPSRRVVREYSPDPPESYRRVFVAAFSRRQARLWLAGGNEVDSGERFPYEDPFCTVVDLDSGVYQDAYVARDTRSRVVMCLDISPDERLLAFETFGEHLVRIYSIAEQRIVHEMRHQHIPRLETLRWSPCGRFLAAGGEMGVTVWDTEGLRVAASVAKGNRSTLAWRRDGLALGFLDGDAEPCVMNLENVSGAEPVS